DVAVEILQKKHIVLFRYHYELHAGVVDYSLVVLNFGIIFRRFADAFEEETVREFHNVGFVNCGNAPASALSRIFESELRNSHAGSFGYYLQTLDYSGNDYVFDARIEVFRVFANNNQIDILESSLNSGQILYRAQVCKQIEAFAKRHVRA